MDIVKMTKEDIAEVLLLDKECFISPWDEAQFTYELENNPFANLLVAKEKNVIVGFIDFWITFEFGSINQIAVIPTYRQQGIASLLLKHAFDQMVNAGVYEVTLEVRYHNQSAIAFYKKHGFTVLLTKEHYYDNGDDAYYMGRRLVYGQDNFSD